MTHLLTRCFKNGDRSDGGRSTLARFSDLQIELFDQSHSFSHVSEHFTWTVRVRAEADPTTRLRTGRCQPANEVWGIVDISPVQFERFVSPPSYSCKV